MYLRKQENDLHDFDSKVCPLYWISVVYTQACGLTLILHKLTEPKLPPEAQKNRF